MSIYLGKPDYSPVKGYSELNVDFDNVNSTIFIKEGKVIKQGENFVFCMAVERMTDVYKPETFQKDSFVCLTIHTKPYEKYVLKDKTRKTIEPLPLEIFIADWLNSDGSIWLENNFTGKLSLNSAESVITAIKENKLWKVLAEFINCAPVLIKDVETTSFAKKSYASAKESERLADRQAFFISSCGSFLDKNSTFPEAVISLTQMRIDAPQQYETLMALLEIIL